MTDTTAPEVKHPWYKESYVWLVIFFPALAIVSGMLMLYLAISSYDGLVFDDYYKRGLEINRSLARDKAAADYGFTAQVETYPDQQRVYVSLTQSAEVDYQFPKTLVLYLSHHTRGGYDQEISLQRVGDTAYQGVLPELIEGVWSVQLATDEWRLLKSVRLSTVSRFALTPNLPAAPTAADP